MKKLSEVTPKKLPREAYRALEDVVGTENITEDRVIVETYSRGTIDPAGVLAQYEKDPTIIPACVVLPANTEEVQAIVKVCNRYKIPFTPFTNFQMLSSPTVPGTLCIHLKRMDKILDIDEENMTATVEAFVDYARLQVETMKRGLWMGGMPLSTAICKLSSHFAIEGVWTTDLKYGMGMNRNYVCVKCVLPNGEIVRTGSSAVAGAGSFLEYAPGPDLHGILRTSIGVHGIICEITVKLHPWVGGPTLPEPPAGRPSIPTYADAKYDAGSPPPKRYKLYWVEYPDLKSEVDALYKIAHSGIGIGMTTLSAAWFGMMLWEEAEKYPEFLPWGEKSPLFTVCVIIAGISSEKQIEYEEKVLKQIAAETGGKLLSKDYKPEVLELLSYFNLESFRSIITFRAVRPNYGGVIIPIGTIDSVFTLEEYWCDAVKRFGPTSEPDRMGCISPIIYVQNRGHYACVEADNFPHYSSKEEVEKVLEWSFDGTAAWTASKEGAGPSNIKAEPQHVMFPETGPDSHLLWRKFRNALDPNSLAAPGRLVWTEEEFKRQPKKLIDTINKYRVLHGLKPIEQPK